MAELLSQDKEMAASFLNSVLNQLNWAFSEFIGMIQEVRREGGKEGGRERGKVSVCERDGGMWREKGKEIKRERMRVFVSFGYIGCVCGHARSRMCGGVLLGWVQLSQIGRASCRERV